MKVNMRSVFFVVAAYCAWGVLPLYWKLLGDVPAPIVLLNRVTWSLVFLGFLVFLRGNLRDSVQFIKNPRVFVRMALSALFITANWLIYVWAMAHGRIIEAGLGYFVCPMMSVALSAMFLGERISRMQLYAGLIVASGVAIKVFSFGDVPWVGLSLALTFALYVFVRKSLVADSVQGLFQEVLIAFPVVLVAAWLSQPQAAWIGYGSLNDLLLVAAGPITALPLLWLVKGIRGVPLHLAAILQYITPTCTILMGCVAGEALSRSDWVAFAIIWSGVGLYLFGERVWRGVVGLMGRKTGHVYFSASDLVVHASSEQLGGVEGVARKRAGLRRSYQYKRS